MAESAVIRSLIRYAAAPGLRGAIAAVAILLVIGAAQGSLGLSGFVAAITAITVGALAGRQIRPRVPASTTVMRHEDQTSGQVLLASIPAPMIVVNRRAVVQAANKAAKSLLPLLEVQHPLSFALRAPDVLDAIAEVLKSGVAKKLEYSERIPTARTFEIQVAPLHADKEGAVLFFQDQTAMRGIERMRIDFIANASHELRTPLASILGFIETLQGPARNDAEARERFLEIMRGQAQRMKRLIEDLLSLSRIELHAHLAPDTAVDIELVLRQIIDTAAPLAREQGVHIEINVADGPFTVFADPDEMLRLVENLINNALKYGGTGKRIEISLSHWPEAEGRPGDVEIAVRDFGPGIAPEHIPRLTERFYRADVNESRQKGGTGLGLAIVKHILVRHRGRLAIESEPGQGATFRVMLPAAASDA